MSAAMNNSFLVLAFAIILVISGIFSMFGKGGGSLYTPVLVMLGMSVGLAVPTALFLNLVTALVATLVFWRNKLVDFRFCWLFLPGTIVGSLTGAVLGSRAPGDTIMGIFAVFLFVAGVMMFISAKEKGVHEIRGVSRGMVALVVVFSLGVGVLSSLLGVGGGLLIFPFLVLYMKYQAQKAAGANAFIVTVSSIVGSAGHFALQHVDYRVIAITSVACVIGSIIGSYVTVKASPTFVKVGFALILWFFSVQIALNLLKVL